MSIKKGGKPFNIRHVGQHVRATCAARRPGIASDLIIGGHHTADRGAGGDLGRFRALLLLAPFAGAGARQPGEFKREGIPNEEKHFTRLTHLRSLNEPQGRIN